MDTIILILLFAFILGVIGAVVYLFVDYNKFKKTTKDTEVGINSSLGTEANTRVSNIQYVVDQMNTVNTDIASNMDDLTRTVQWQKNHLDKVDRWEQKTLASINSAFTFTSNVGSIQPLDFWSVPGSVAPDMQLIKHVTALSGITASNLAADTLTSNRSVQFCPADTSKCISFPDVNGDTVLTGFTNNAQIKMKSTTSFASNISFTPISYNSVVNPLSMYSVTTTNAANPALVLNAPSVIINNGPLSTVPTIIDSAGQHTYLQVGSKSAIGDSGIVTNATNTSNITIPMVTPIDTTKPLIYADGNGNLIFNTSNIKFMGTKN